MAARNYSNIAVSTTLASGIGAGDSSLTVADASGWPSAPFLLVIDPDTANEEIVLVAGKAGTTFSSLTRGFGGTSGVAHNAGVDVKHITVAEDHTLIWAHVHSGAGGDDTAIVPHTNLSTVGADDHHAQDHATRHSDGGADEMSVEDLATADTDVSRALRPDGSGGLAFSDVAHSDLSGVTADTHHNEDHASRHQPGGADALDITDFEVDESVEVNGPVAGPTGGFSSVASVTLTIPATWNSWKCVAYASYTVQPEVGSTAYEAKINIDGTDQQTKHGHVPPSDENHIPDGSVGGRRTGMTTTGNRTVSLLFQLFASSFELEDIYLYARAVRTS